VLAEGGGLASGVGSLDLKVDIAGWGSFVGGFFGFGKQIVEARRECRLVPAMPSHSIGKSLFSRRTALLQLGDLLGQIERGGPGKGRGVTNNFGRDRINRENPLAAGASDFERFVHDL